MRNKHNFSGKKKDDKWISAYLSFIFDKTSLDTFFMQSKPRQGKALAKEAKSA